MSSDACSLCIDETYACFSAALTAEKMLPAKHLYSIGLNLMCSQLFLIVSRCTQTHHGLRYSFCATGASGSQQTKKVASSVEDLAHPAVHEFICWVVVLEQEDTGGQRVG